MRIKLPPKDWYRLLNILHHYKFITEYKQYNRPGNPCYVKKQRLTKEEVVLLDKINYFWSQINEQITNKIWR